MIFVDSNVLIDIFAADETWRVWSDRQIVALIDGGEELVVNNIVVAEIAGNFPNSASLLDALDRLDVTILPLESDVAFNAGEAFRRDRRLREDRGAILADFLIGAHAAALSIPLLTRDTKLYRRCFPDLPLITPETHS